MLNTLPSLNRFYLFALLVLSGILGGCGGGGVSNSNSPISVQPGTADVFAGNPVVFGISGGKGPYTVFSSNQTAIPLASNSVSGNSFVINPSPVGADTVVTITAQDANGAIGTSTVTVKPALVNLTVTPDPAAPGTGCTPAVCSGQNAAVTVQTVGPSRTVRFDVVQGDYLFTSNVPGTTFVSSITAVTDVNGLATVRLRANVNAPTQTAIIRATDVGSGAFLQTAFTIAQFTDGVGTLSVLPAKVTIETTAPASCSSGAQAFYTILGGTPPYRIINSSPQIATVSPTSVPTNGGGFTATTVGALCGEATFVITDATGRTITATLDNKLSAAAATPPATPPTSPPPPAALTVAQAGGGTTCPTGAFPRAINYTITGGTAPYFVGISPSGATVTPVSSSAPYTFTVTVNSAGTYTINVSDSGGASRLVTLACT